MAELYELIQDRKKELKDVHDRMDKDRELVNLEKFVFKDVKDNKVPNAISVTLNDPAVFATTVESSLNSATEQITVASSDKKVDTGIVEDVLRAVFGSSNERLTKGGGWPLNPFFDQQMTRRGRAFARVLCRVEDGVFIPDIAYWDSRFVYDGLGPDGMQFAGYETYMSVGGIRKEGWYNDPKCKFEIDKIKGGATVTDAWDSEHHEVFINKDRAFEEPHSYGYCPVVFQLVPMGSMLSDKEDFKSQGESIFFLIRDLIPELNRLVSIIQSLNQKAFDNAMLWKTPEGIEGTPPDYDKLTQPGQVTSAAIGGGAEPVSFGQLRREAWLLHTMIETRIQRGSVSNLDLGIMGNQPWSAVSLITLGEGRDQVFLPRLGARGMLNTQIADMALEQIVQSGQGNVEIGTRGHKRSFRVAKLQGEFEITFEYFVKSPQVDVARYSMAAAAGNLIPERAKRRDILQREDPDDDEKWLRWEQAEVLSPMVKYNRTIQALRKMAEEGDEDADFEAELMSAEMGMIAQQAGAQPQPKPEEAKKPEPLVPLFGAGAGRPTSAQKSADIQGSPEEGA